MTENPRAVLKIVYSCFDCDYFKNKMSSHQIEKEKYRCMLEKKDFEFSDMTPDGVPGFCQLPTYTSIKSDKIAKKFGEIFNKLDTKQ